MFTPCTLCHSTNAEIIRDTLRYDIKRKVLRCNDCTFVYLETPDATNQDYYTSKTYRETYGPNLKKKGSEPKEIYDTYFPFQGVIIDALKDILRPDMNVLDVGCSTGQFLSALKGKVAGRIGMELSEADVAFIRENLDFKVYSEPIEDAVIPEGPFDMVSALQVVEHVPDPVSFVQHLGKHLKPDGYLYLELPNIHDSMLDAYHIKGYENFYYREPHLSYFSEKTLGDLLAKAGFVGKIKTVQRYTFTNHLHWLLTGNPQDNFTLGNQEPILVTTDTVSPPVKQELNDFIRRVNREYIDLIEKHGMGESLTFLGKKAV